jgi:ketosteroid isomerase-like protein
MQVSEHRNLLLVQRVAAAVQMGLMSDAADVFDRQVVWHYFNPRLPHLAGDYTGLDGIATFFDEIARETRGTFRMEPVTAAPIGDELVVTQGRITFSLAGRAIMTDAVVVWRIQDGRITEVWDIPAVHASYPRR